MSASKARLRARIAELEAEVAALKDKYEPDMSPALLFYSLPPDHPAVKAAEANWNRTFGVQGSAKFGQAPPIDPRCYFLGADAIQRGG
jgi:hypothetical protein